jgi:hypothetical protein
MATFLAPIHLTAIAEAVGRFILIGLMMVA